jgi:hypothetical protein
MTHYRVPSDKCHYKTRDLCNLIMRDSNRTAASAERDLFIRVSSGLFIVKSSVADIALAWIFAANFR